MEYIQSGKYTFAIKETAYNDRDGDIMYKTIKMGGNYPDDCVNVVIVYKNNNPFNAKMPHIMYDEECVINENPKNKIILQKGDGSKIMIQTMLGYIKKNYPSIKEVEYDDMSSIECATEDEIKNAINKKRGTNMKPLSLYYLSIAYNGKTWYEKYFNARMQDSQKYAKYREKVDNLLKSKPMDFKEFSRIILVSNILLDELYEYYNLAETYSDFFHAIPKSERCRLLRPWIDKFMDYYLKNIFINKNWIIPLETRGGTRKTRKKGKSFYIPNNIRLNKNYSSDLGITINDL